DPHLLQGNVTAHKLVLHQMSPDLLALSQREQLLSRVGFVADGLKVGRVDLALRFAVGPPAAPELVSKPQCGPSQREPPPVERRGGQRLETETAQPCHSTG